MKSMKPLKRKAKLVAVLFCMTLLLTLIASCTSTTVTNEPVKCNALTRPPIKKVGDLVEWTGVLEESYIVCGSTKIYRKQ